MSLFCWSVDNDAHFSAMCCKWRIHLPNRRNQCTAIRYGNSWSRGGQMCGIHDAVVVLVVAKQFHIHLGYIISSVGKYSNRFLLSHHIMRLLNSFEKNKKYFDISTKSFHSAPTNRDTSAWFIFLLFRFLFIVQQTSNMNFVWSEHFPRLPTRTHL